MKITVLTIFPDMFHDFLNTSIISRSIQKGLVEFEIVDIREYAPGSYRHVDDSPFGGGAGMVMKCQPVLDALDAVKTENSWSVLMSPAGQVYSQTKAHEYAKKDHLILLCGHYEGLDERINHHMDELISIGDYVLTGGELASMVISDSVVRLLKGAIRDESTDEESHENGLLEYPQYTKPADYKGEKVPEILLSGHHENIRKWRLKQSLKLTRERRPDLFAKHELTKEEQKLLKELDDEENNDSE